MGKSQLFRSQRWGLLVVAPLMPLLSVLQISSGSAGKEVLTSIFSATAETLSTSTTTHVTKVRAAPKGEAMGFLMEAAGVRGQVDLCHDWYSRKCPSPPYKPKKRILSHGGCQATTASHAPLSALFQVHPCCAACPIQPGVTTVM